MAVGTRTGRNHLSHATSPYLLQHASNPVEWYEWRREALHRARTERKPIFLSIGYSACHWCHVMARESFEDEATAEVMNENFVNIKVDREERPDLDAIYMQATMILNRGQGGWPMSVWLTPDLRPFFAGTYFPPQPAFGRPGFRDLCRRIGELWKTRRDDLLAEADRLTEAVIQSLEPGRHGAAALTQEGIDRAAQAVAGGFDRQRGGMLNNGTIKFPPSLALDLFLRLVHRHGPDAAQSRELLALVNLTLDHMARGGIFDQLGGGIHRYSTDPAWHVPHFEKMLYDQALVSRVFVDAHLVTKNPLYRRVACELFDFVLGELQAPGGGFYSARDADSEGVEGKYYVWTKAEILASLGPEEGELFCDYYGVTAEGNWRDPHAPGEVKNVLHVPRSLEEFARMRGADPAELEPRLAAARRKLLAVRSGRVPPALDDKILVEWNALMIASLARGGAALSERKCVDAAIGGAQFILDHQCRDGRLQRVFRDGRTGEIAFLSDYAAFIEALLELYEATFDKRWLEQALELNRTVIEQFGDRRAGGFFLAPSNHEPRIARFKDARDGATPAGNSMQLMNLLRLSAITGDRSLRHWADQTMSCFAADVLQFPTAGARFLAAAEFALTGPVEVTVVGDQSSDGAQQLWRHIHSRYLPNRVLLHADPAHPQRNIAAPALQEKRPVDGSPAVYVCRDQTCFPPATTVGQLDELLVR
ncbi:MAG TPA: thioredoxin domain-containing protein [Phycisphaerae bacterium]|nr:thioredoxin domain-containing protein [Phycisphaerae bacterium]